MKGEEFLSSPQAKNSREGQKSHGKMRKPRICKICGKEFLPDKYHPNQEVCFDPQCQHARQVSNQGSWRKNNPDYFKYKGGTTVWEKKRAQYLRLWRQNHKDYFKNYRRKKSLPRTSSPSRSFLKMQDLRGAGFTGQ